MSVVKYWIAVVIAFALIVSLSWCARAQEAQIGPKWEPVRIEVTMHRHHVHKHKRHHRSANGNWSVGTHSSSRHADARGLPKHMPSEALTLGTLSVTSPSFIEFVTWCVARALPCILPGR